VKLRTLPDGRIVCADDHDEDQYVSSDAGETWSALPCPSCDLLRAQVADLTRHAEAMARWDCRTCSGGARLGPPDPMGSDCDECPVAAYRRDHPLPPEKP
jgi:hypothetical protein